MGTHTEASNRQGHRFDGTYHIFTSGCGFDTLPIYVEEAIRRGTITTINALSTLMIGFTLFLVIITKRVRKFLLTGL